MRHQEYYLLNKCNTFGFGQQDKAVGLQFDRAECAAPGEIARGATPEAV
jgi:hypothetical protein